MHRVLPLVAACAPGPDGPHDLAEDASVAACPAPGAARVVSDAFVGGTEGLAVAPDGRAWVAGADRLVQLAPDGTITEVAAIRGAVGAAWWRGAVWVATGRDEAGAAAPALVEVSPEGEVLRHPLVTLARPNFVLPTPWGTLLVSDDFDTRIAEWRDGVDRVWAEGVPSPNGLGLSPGGDTLYVASTFVEPGLQALDVTAGQAGALRTLTSFAQGTAPDGLVVAADGSVLVALNLAGRVERWGPDGVSVIAEDLPFVASLAFGRGPWDPCSVLATSLFGETVWEVPVGGRGP